ncbi:MAG: hypothetical protein ACI4KM_04315 [Oscillospiraceae bacterium]
MNDLIYTIFLAASAVTLTVGFIIFIADFRGKSGDKSGTSAFIKLIAGMYAAMVLMFIPLFYCSYELGDNFGIIRPFLLSALCSIKVFILESDYDMIVEAAAWLNEPLRILYTGYAAFMLIAAPFVTLGSVLALLQGFTNSIRFRLCRRRPMYIMSDLNENSLALAEDITQRFKAQRPMIVFAETMAQDDEHTELLSAAKAMGAIVLKKDISQLKLQNKKAPVEIFLIGEDESDNVQKAADITNRLCREKSNRNIKIFAFSAKECGAHIINSLKYTELLGYLDKPEEIRACCSLPPTEAKKGIQAIYAQSEGFRLRRVDTVKNLVMSEIIRMDPLSIAKDKKLSVLIVGFGRVGKEFFRKISWYCSVCGYSLEFNIVDIMGEKGGNAIESVIGRAFPALLEDISDKGYTYSVRCFSGIDSANNDLRELIEKGDNAQRLKRTNLAIVCTGDDDRNIETAVYLREIFDRVQRPDRPASTGLKPEDETVRIYAFVRDQDSYTDLCGLINCEGTPYNITMIGSTRSRYSHSNIYDSATEAEALNYHIGWIIDDNDYRSNPAQTAEKLLSELKRYEQFEYYRESSISRAVFSDMLFSKFTMDCESHEPHRQVMPAKWFEDTEHLRWNAYMRGSGFEYGEPRSFRAKRHKSIVRCDRLSEDERNKDRQDWRNNDL